MLIIKLGWSPSQPLEERLERMFRSIEAQVNVNVVTSAIEREDIAGFPAGIALLPDD